MRGATAKVQLPGRVPAGMAFFLTLLGRMAYSDRMSQRGTDHFLRAARPALIKAGGHNQNREIVPRLISSARRTGGTLGHVVPPRLPYFSQVIQNPELWETASPL